MVKNMESVKINSIAGKIICIIVILGVIAGMAIYMLMYQDRVAPELSFDKETLFLSKEEVFSVMHGEMESLLNGMHAVDDVDGDLTDKIIPTIGDISWYDAYAVVSYKVMDKAGNVSTTRRLVYLKTWGEIHEIGKKYYGY